MKQFILAGLLLLLASAAQAQTHLATVASGLAPGQFGALTVPTWTQSLNGFGKSTDFAYKATYDWERRRVIFLGGGHTNMPDQCTSLKFYAYDIGTNVAIEFPCPVEPTGTELSTNVHTYGHLTYNQAKRRFYYIRNGSSTLFRANLDHDSLASFTNSDWTTDPVGLPPTQFRTNIEFFPERNELWYMTPDAALYRRNETTETSWTTVNADLFPGEGGLECPFMLYNAKHKHMLLGGGKSIDYVRKMRRVNADGTLTNLPDSPIDIFACGSSLPTIDPVSGKFLVFSITPLDVGSGTSFVAWEMDPTCTTSTAACWMQRTDIAANVPDDLCTPGNPKSVFDCVTVPLLDQGVILFLGATKISIYKHTANTLAADGVPFPTRAAAPGVLGSWAFDNVSELKYGWFRPDAAMDAHMVSLGITDWYAIGNNRLPGEGNVTSVTHNSGAFSVPWIDTAEKVSGAASIRFTIPPYSGEGVGVFQDNFDKVLHTDDAVSRPIRCTACRP